MQVASFEQNYHALLQKSVLKATPRTMRLSEKVEPLAHIQTEEQPETNNKKTGFISRMMQALRQQY